MSTRRARIKAVAALPPRRKNQENADAKNQPKENIEKVLKSPRTPRSQVDKSEDENSPSKKTIRNPPPLLPTNHLSKEPIPEEEPVPANVDSPKVVEKTANTPKSEKVPVITTAPQDKSVFASPRVKNSPDRRRNASPLVLQSPKPSSGDESAQKFASPNISKASNNYTTGESSGNQNEKALESTSTREVEKRSDIPDDYSIPSIPESVTDESVMDGIVPLKSANIAPKPIEVLKNEIISDNVEVSFDPIVPLPSPSKVRPKLRPVPRLAPHRRNSIQGSASESEDESRRCLLSGGAATPAPPRQRHDSHTSHTTPSNAPNREVNRIRNDSVSSSVSQLVTQPPPATSPVKEKHFSNKVRRQEMSRRSWCRRREVKRDALTMYDLIFYNPTTNPIIPDEDEVEAKEANAKEEAERIAKSKEEEKKGEEEDNPDDPPAGDAAPVPQIKLGPNGEIILDEQSLVIKQSGANRKVSSVVREGSWAGSGSGRYTRSARTAEWSQAETVRFYRALAAIGTDFSLMAQLFPGRNRKDLYLKFKKEERLNGGQVDKALRTATSWDPAQLEEEFKREREEQATKDHNEKKRLQELKEEERERAKAFREHRIRKSKASKALESSVTFNKHAECTADEFIRRSLRDCNSSNSEMDTNKKISAKRKADDTLLVTSTQILNHPAPTSGFATLTPGPNNQKTAQPSVTTEELATISRIDQAATKQVSLNEELETKSWADQPTQKQVSLNEVAGVPSNIETGSLVVLRVNDPASPSKTMLQTYIAHGAGKLTPISLPPDFLSSVLGYMKKGTPRSTVSSASSPQLTSPGSVVSQDSTSATPSVIQINPSPNKRQRHSSYSITQL